MVHNIFVGRRKTAVARAFLIPGAGNITVNGKEVSKYFPTEMLLEEVRLPLTVTETNERYDVHVRVRGGGSHGQAGAVKMSIARALVAVDEEFRPRLRAYHLLTRDSRMVERKKYGQKKARKRFQFSKR
ncbi:MAG: 30S ribosomal protein S9 [Bacteroidota bacterium]|jgi:small subunit ribosomal protein S9|nr:30S ribosomal protein S9 [Bacteroidota bacterium]